MLEYDRINISERIDVNKTNLSKEYDSCYDRYFLDKNFNYEPYLWDGCHDLMMLRWSLLPILIILFTFGI